MYEGIGKYIGMFFIFIFIIYIIVKICLASIFKKAGIQGWKAFVPIYGRYVLTQKLDLKIFVFLMTLVPVARFYYFYIIIEKLLEAFEQDTKEAIWFLVVPLYKFPELVFKNPEFTLHLYDATKQFIHNEKSLFETPKVEEIQSVDMTGGTIISPALYNQNNNIQTPYTETVFSNENLEPDERQETYIEAKVEETNLSQNPINPINTSNLKPKICPKCGTKLEGSAKTCFFCGTSVWH